MSGYWNFNSIDKILKSCILTLFKAIIALLDIRQVLNGSILDAVSEEVNMLRYITSDRFAENQDPPGNEEVQKALVRIGELIRDLSCEGNYLKETFSGYLEEFSELSEAHRAAFKHSIGGHVDWIDTLAHLLEERLTVLEKRLCRVSEPGG